MLSYMQVLMSRPREETRMDVAARYRALEQFSKEDARVQFLRILRSLPYGVLPAQCDVYGGLDRMCSWYA